MSVDFGGPAYLTFNGGATVACDLLNITPVNVMWSNAPTAFQITASQVGALNMTAAVVSPLLVRLSQTGQNVTLQWYGTGILQTSSNLNNWSTLSGAAAPYIMPISGTKQFFRVGQ